MLERGKWRGVGGGEVWEIELGKRKGGIGLGMLSRKNFKLNFKC